MPTESEQIRKFTEFDPDDDLSRTNTERRHFTPRAGDRILINRTRLRLTTNKEFSTESVEVIDVVER